MNWWKNGWMSRGFNEWIDELIDELIKGWVNEWKYEWMNKFTFTIHIIFQPKILIQWRTAVAQSLRCCATNRKAAGSIPARVIGIFHWHKILPIALWLWGRLSLQQKWVPGVFPEGKSGRFVRLTTYHHPGPLSRNLGTLTSSNLLGL